MVVRAYPLVQSGLKHTTTNGLGRAANWIMVTDDFSITQAELTSVVSNLNKSDLLTANGVVLGGSKFICLSSTESIEGQERHRRRYNKTISALILGIYDETIEAGQGETVVEKMEDHLTEKKTSLQLSCSCLYLLECCLVF